MSIKDCISLVLLLVEHSRVLSAFLIITYFAKFVNRIFENFIPQFDSKSNYKRHIKKCPEFISEHFSFLLHLFSSSC